VVPDYRVTMTMGALRPGVVPADVLPAAKAAAAELTMVEAADVTIVAGSARIVIRFESDDAELATQIAAHVVATTRTSVEVRDVTVTERSRGRWFRVG
jgi:hypothetical protein